MKSLISTKQFALEVEEELFNNILPFWMEKTLDTINGGFWGVVFNDLTVEPKAEKGCILNTRILWTFSAAYRLKKQEIYRKIADRAFKYIKEYFWDPDCSGLFFMVNHQGVVTNPRKQVYNLAFGIYGFSEYYRATGVRESLDLALELYRLVEEYAYDPIYKGYFEAFSQDWRAINEMRLSPKDVNSPKSMNTHLHLLEAYTNLFRVWPNEKLRIKVSELISIMADRIIDPKTNHFRLFFDEQWNSKVNTVSYGHDIEGSWLIYEAAEVLGDIPLRKRAKKLAINMAERVYQEGIDHEYGGLFSEKTDDVIEKHKEWWPQSEAIVGFLNAFQLTGKDYYLEAAYQMWRYCQKFFIDKVNGEWFYLLSREGLPNEKYYKVGPWKCPYHNGRACMEVMSRSSSHFLKNGVLAKTT